MKTYNCYLQQTQLIILVFPQQKDQYLQFNSLVPQQILTLFKEPNFTLKNKLIKTLYNQIAGICNLQKQFFLYDENFFLKTVKSISIFGGLRFYGQRFNKKLREMFKLKLTDIQGITFSNIIQLNFSCCDLVSVQAIAQLQMKNLIQIDLNDNNIVSLKPFKKSTFLKLIDLNLSNNHFKYHQLESLNRFKCPEINKIQFFKQEHKIPPDVQDMRVFAKFQIDKRRWKRRQFLKVILAEQNKHLQKTSWIKLASKHALVQFKTYEWEYQ